VDTTGGTYGVEQAISHPVWRTIRSGNNFLHFDQLQSNSMSNSYRREHGDRIHCLATIPQAENATMSVGLLIAGFL
jgi:hypothetical protein